LSTGYSGTPLPRKLGLKPGQKALLLSVPIEIKDITEFPGFSDVKKRLPSNEARRFDYIHLFVKNQKSLETKLPQIRSSLLPDGILWVSWPKKSSGIASDITGNTLRSLILPTGLVDVKVCAVNDIWSGLKFMFRKELRSGL